MAIHVVSISEDPITFSEGDTENPHPYHIILPEEDIVLTETLVTHGSLDQSFSEPITFSETLTVHGIPLSLTVNETVAVQETTYQGWAVGIFEIDEDPLVITEILGVQSPGYRITISEALSVFESAGRGTFLSLTDTLVATDQIQIYSEVSLSDTVSLVEVMSLSRSKGVRDFVNIFESVCPRSSLIRGIQDTVIISDYTYAYHGNIDNVNNNPVLVGYNDLATANYNTLSAYQYNNLLLTTPVDNTGFVNFPLVYYGIINEEIMITETKSRIGGHALCD